MRTLQILAALGAVILTSCGVEDAGAPTLSVAIQALQLPAVTDAVYRLTVTNEAGELVWTRDINTSTYGDGAGSATYIGTCDAQDFDGDGQALNSVAFSILELPPLGPSDWVNPTANGPMVKTAACVENGDTSVDFQFAILRAANQGFFDVAVNFDDIFCSAKLDCVDDFGAPLDLLHNPQTSQREPTVVMALACTAGPGAATELHMDDVQIVCANGSVFSVDPSVDGVGAASPPLIFSSLVLRGSESLTNASKGYWNVAIGIDDAALGDPATGLTDCVFKGRATASDGGFPNGATPPGVTYPYVNWEVPLNQAGGLTCTQHPMGGGNGVSVIYGQDVSFAHSYTPTP